MTQFVGIGVARFLSGRVAVGFRQPALTALNFHPRRCFVSDSNDPSDTANKIKESDNDSKRGQKQLIDVDEYYSQYIKEYQQADFKDEESVQWELRREKSNMTRGRGQAAVMDVDELVEFLRAERVNDVCTMRMPNVLAYAPYMVIGTPLSRRHLGALTEKLRTAYKKKRAVYDPAMMRIEDDDNPEWRVFDLGSVVVHLMTRAARKRYDIEMLWTVGPDHDELSNSQEQMDEYSDRLKQLQLDVARLSNLDDSQDAANV